MYHQQIKSREYKLVLKTENFTGSESDLIVKTNIFWKTFTKLLQPVILNANGNPDTISIKREIRFYDTKDFMLNNLHYIFRERTDLVNHKKEVTLKFRHPDHIISFEENINIRQYLKRGVKLEEDIKAKFMDLYSCSATLKITDDLEFKKIKHIQNLYPGLSFESIKNPKNEMVFLVNDLVIQEIVVTGSTIILCHDPLVTAECALIFWYETEAFTTDPRIVEFSFRYKKENEQFNSEAAKNAYDLFLGIQEKMDAWITIEGKTKTGFVYGDQ